MSGTANRKKSISMELAALAIVSLAAAAVFFFAFYYFSRSYIENHYETQDYVQQKNEQLAEKLGNEIQTNQIASGDTDFLERWIKKQGIISLQVFKDDRLIFDSDYPDSSGEWQVTSDDYFGWESYYNVEFTDGSADVFLSGNYSYRLYTFAFVAGLCLAFVVFLLIFLLGIRKTIRYITQLRKEVAVLEVGGLDCPITVSGRDELTELAKGLDAMRISLKNQMEQEAVLTRNHKKLITGMSHDLRTPLTSILLYTELMQKDNVEQTEFMKKYAGKIEKKARQMKNLTERIFEYSLTDSTDKIPAGQAARFQDIFYDQFSEVGTYLEQNGFRTEWEVSWEDVWIQANPDLVSRILDNITSNILKYADPGEPVRIESTVSSQTLNLTFENAVLPPDASVESSGIGVPNIRNMMESMGGFCSISQTKNSYQITLHFSLVKSED